MRKYIARLSKEEFIRKARLIHGDFYDYSKVKYINNHTKVTIICPVHGEFKQLPMNHLKGAKCYKCHLENIGKWNKSNRDEFIQKAKKVHGDKYNYDLVYYSLDNHKVKIKCNECQRVFEQTPNAHLQGQGCYKCSLKKNGENKILKYKLVFESRAREVHDNKYGYLNFKYRNSSIKGLVTCFEHGDFLVTPSNHLKGKGCPICKLSKGELAIKKILDKNNIEYTREYMIPNQIYKFRYDFYLPKHNMLIEFHGEQHYKYIQHFHSNKETFIRKKEVDLFKKCLAKELNYKFIEFDYKQLYRLTKEKFELLVIQNIKNRE